MESKYLLPEEVYNDIIEKFKNGYNSQEIEFLQSFFNKTNEKGIQTLWKFFSDRQTIINEEEEIQARNPIIHRNSYFLGF